MKTNFHYLLAVASVALMPVLAGAHEGHNEFGGFSSPNKGTFARVGDRVVELYLKDGKLNLCFYAMDGSLAKVDAGVSDVELKVSEKGSQPVTLSAAKDTAGCSDWDFSTKAKRLTVDLSVKVRGKPKKARLVYRIK